MKTWSWIYVNQSMDLEKYSGASLPLSLGRSLFSFPSKEDQVEGYEFTHSQAGVSLKFSGFLLNKRSRIPDGPAENRPSKQGAHLDQPDRPFWSILANSRHTIIVWEGAYIQNNYQRLDWSPWDLAYLEIKVKCKQLETGQSEAPETYGWTSASYQGFSEIGRREAGSKYILCSWGKCVTTGTDDESSWGRTNKTKHKKRRCPTRLVNEGVHGWRLAEARTEAWSGTGARRGHVAPRRRCAGFQNRRAGFFMLVSLNKLNEY